MLNVKKMVKQRDKIKVRFTKNAIKRSLEDFEFNTNIIEIEDKFSRCLVHTITSPKNN